MCLSVPGQIVRVVETTPGERTAEVDFAGVRRTVNLVFLPEATVGDYVIVHAGCATARLSEAEALEAQAHFREIRQLSEPTGA